MIYFILGAFARRWYGGMFPDDKYKILGNRALQTAFMLALFMAIYVKQPNDVLSWVIAAVISCWLQFQFWSSGHGCCFDLGRGGYPTPETIKRYNERWYHIPCDWLAKKGYFPYYGEKYDFYYMTLRYACPMIPMMFFDWRYILIGLSIAPVYEFCWTFKLKLNKSRLNSPTKIAELICGGIVYSGCYILGL